MSDLDAGIEAVLSAGKIIADLRARSAEVVQRLARICDLLTDENGVRPCPEECVELAVRGVVGSLAEAAEEAAASHRYTEQIVAQNTELERRLAESERQFQSALEAHDGVIDLADGRLQQIEELETRLAAAEHRLTRAVATLREIAAITDDDCCYDTLRSTPVGGTSTYQCGHEMARIATAALAEVGEDAKC